MDRAVLEASITSQLSGLAASIGVVVDATGYLDKAIKEMNITITDIDPDTTLALAVEIRALYYGIMAFRIPASANFKYDTGNEGKSVDKTDVPKNLRKLALEFDNEYNELMESVNTNDSNKGSLFTLPIRTPTRLS